MKFFSSRTVIVHWIEPDWFFYVARKGTLVPKLYFSLIALFILGGIFGSHRVILLGLALLLMTFAGRRLYPIWPKIFPVLNNRATLYDDRIELQAFRSSARIALDNIAECRCSQALEQNGIYCVLSFTPKRPRFFGGLTEIAIPSSHVAEEVAHYLRSREISVISVPYSTAIK